MNIFNEFRLSLDEILGWFAKNQLKMTFVSMNDINMNIFSTFMNLYDYIFLWNTKVDVYQNVQAMIYKI